MKTSETANLKDINSTAPLEIDSNEGDLASNGDSEMHEPLTKPELDATAASYLGIIQTNRPFRLFLYSYIANHTGEWLTYLASIAAIEDIQRGYGEKTTSKSLISLLVIVRLLPNVLMSPLGGVLADGRDRRKVMIALDIGGAFTSLLFILAVTFRSIPMIFGAAFLQDILTGLYEPSRTAIIPLLVPDEEEMKLASTLTGVAWSVVAAFGSAAGGLLVVWLGKRGCYLVDSFTYLLSAWLMYKVGGTWNVASNEDDKGQSIWSSCYDMIFGGLQYIRTCSFGALVFMKASAAILFGPYDVLNVAISERGNHKGQSARLGLMFGAVGVGCLLGPLLMDYFTDMNRPKSLQIACICSIALCAFGGFLMGMKEPFWVTVCLNMIRSMGTSTVWINSSLLLQKFSVPEMLGRVSSIEYSVALLSEALAAAAAGVLVDRGISAEEVSMWIGVLGASVTFMWTLYHCRGGGASSYQPLKKEDDDVETNVDFESAASSKSNAESRKRPPLNYVD